MSDGALLALNLAEARDGLARKVFSARALAALESVVAATAERALATALDEVGGAG